MLYCTGSPAEEKGTQKSMKTYNDVFVEELVVRHRPAVAAAIRLGAVFLGLVLSVAFYYLTGMLLRQFANALFPALFALTWVGVFLACRYVRLEYEYSFFSGTVDVDRIRGKRKRDTLLSFSCTEVELMAPYVPAYESALSGPFDRKLDVRGTGKGEQDWFIIYKTQDGTRGLIAFSPSDRLVDAFRQFVRGGRFHES